jgi:DNA-binding response OmpR family regulator
VNEQAPAPGVAAAPGRAGYVLIVGEENADLEYVVAALRWGHLEVHACNEAALLEIHDLQPPVLTVLDHGGGAADVKASQERLLRHGGLIGVPLLVLSYDAAVDTYSAAIAGGAAAYLVKPVDAQELVAVARKLSGWLGVTEDSEKRRRMRRPLLMKVEVHLRARKERTSGQIVDASGGGCRIELGTAVAPGDLIRLELHSHKGSTHVALGGEIRWYRQAPDGTHVAGVKFTGTTAQHAPQLLGFATPPADLTARS